MNKNSNNLGAAAAVSGLRDADLVDREVEQVLMKGNNA